MKKLQTKKLFTLLTLIMLSLFVTQVIWAQSNYDQAIGGGQKAIDEAFGGGTPIDVTGGGTGDPFVYGLFQIINSLLTFTGIIFFLILIYGGYLWMFARGREEQVTKAKQITKDAIIGIVIIVLARIITEFILVQIGTAIINQGPPIGAI